MKLVKAGRLADDFVRWSGPRATAEFQGLTAQLPFHYNRSAVIQSLHTVSFEALRDLLPSDELYPVRWFDGRAVVVVLAARYSDVSSSSAEGRPLRMEPYGEVEVAALVSRKPLRRGLPLLRPGMPNVGSFVLDMAVTHAFARDSGRALYGLPKFVADVHFYEEPALRRADVWDLGVHALSVEVRPGGPLRKVRLTLPTYSVLGGQLLETTVPFLGWGQRSVGHGGDLRLGRHPVADRLAELDIVQQGFMCASYLDVRLILPAGVPIGHARAYPGYEGAARDRGEFTVRYPESGAIDQYATFAGARAT